MTKSPGIDMLHQEFCIGQIIMF